MALHALSPQKKLKYETAATSRKKKNLFVPRKYITISDFPGHFLSNSKYFS
jgi:hypothetical protein